jgi:molybdopterin converting factor small subunit
LADDASTEDLFTTLRERHEGLFEADGSLRRAVMLFINGKQQRPNQSAPLSDGAECAFLTPISGG